MGGFRRVRVGAAAVLACLLSAPLAAQQQQNANREVTVQNETDLALQNLYVHPPGAPDRGADRLGRDTVAPSANLRVRLGRTSCTQDVVAIFEDGTEDVRRRVDICRQPRLVFGDPAMPTLEVQVANRSDVVLRELYAARALPESTARASDAWGPDRLGAGVIEPAAGFALRLRTRDCLFDVRGVYADEREEVKARLDLCANRALVFDRSGIPRPPSRTIVLLNRHLAVVQEVYVSPSADSDWGPDRLGSNTLEVGAETTVALEGECDADIRIVFPNGGAEERREVDICENPRLVLAPGWVVETVAEAPGAAPAPAAGPRSAPGPLAIRNSGPLPIVELYAAAPGAPRGADRLGADVLGRGDVVEVGPPDPAACVADLVAVFRDGREVTRAGVDFCQGEEIAFQ